MKVAIIHDDFMQWGGAERVVTAIMELYPDAPVYTLCYEKQVTPTSFDRARVKTSFFQNKVMKRLYHVLFFLHPIAMERFNLNEYDVVISSSSRFAKSVITQPQTKHVAFVNTPPRFLWPVSDAFGPKEYIGTMVHKAFFLLRPLMKVLLIPLLTVLRLHDFSAAQRVDYFLANSKNVATRIKKFYKRNAEVLYPFADQERFQYDQNGIAQDNYFLVISRLASHKRIDLAVDACTALNIPLKIIGTGSERKSLAARAGETIEFLGYLSDDEVVDYVKRCRAFLYPQEEDFGITAVEAQLLGKPVIAYARGGARETVIEGKTGLFFYNQRTDELMQALRKFETMQFNSQIIREHALQFSKDRFKKELSGYVQKIAG